MTPPLSPDEAARLAGAMLQDTLRLAQAVNRVEVTLSHPPLVDEALMAALVLGHVARLIDDGSDLGTSMQHASQNALVNGADSVVLIGADLPHLPGRLIEEAFSLLERRECDVVLGPAVDGGYYLIGLSAPAPCLFTDIDWGTHDVLRQTVARAHSAGLRVHFLAPWRDVDLLADLEWLACDLAAAPDEHAPATRAFLATWCPSCAQDDDLQCDAAHRPIAARHVGWTGDSARIPAVGEDMAWPGATREHASQKCLE